jgi:7,8-dihydropterin-6-yl-methyl-4-(beta-D-ribofuranosyl)aminobenzene 5'-phosphate synthase
LTVLYNNVPFNRNLTTAWGFSCFVQRKDKGILFDTGEDGTILLSNMQKLGVDPAQIDLIVLSHIHGDHTGGLESLLKINANLTVYLPISFPQAFKTEIAEHGAEVVSVAEFGH